MRIPQIDFLRGIAILLVLCRHFHDIHETIYLPFFYKIGWVGVDLFFVISGFLVSGLLFNEIKKNGNINFKRFFIRRGFKIYPSFYALIIFTIVFKLATHKIVLLKSILPELFFYQNYSQGLLVHTWSLAIEEHFYIILPLILIGILYLGLDWFKKNILYVFYLIVFIVLALRINNAFTPFSMYTHVFATHLRIDALIIGTIVAYYYNFRQEMFINAVRKFKYIMIILVCISIITTAYFNVDSIYMYTVGFLINSIGFASLLMVLLINGDNLKDNKFVKALAYVGYYSYTIYLWHIPIEGIFSRYNVYEDNFTFYAYFIMYVFLSVLVGISLGKIIENPFLKLRDKLFPKI